MNREWLLLSGSLLVLTKVTNTSAKMPLLIKAEIESYSASTLFFIGSLLIAHDEYIF